jgi:septation ring formation regulator EzrA
MEVRTVTVKETIQYLHDQEEIRTSERDQAREDLAALRARYQDERQNAGTLRAALDEARDALNEMLVNALSRQDKFGDYIRRTCGAALNASDTSLSRIDSDVD